MPHHLDPDLYPRTYAQARARGMSDKDADALAHVAEREALADVLTTAGPASREPTPNILGSP